MVGDGTNNEVINGIFTQDVVPTTKITMATMPIGTGNDWRRTFDIPLEYDEVAKIIKVGHTYAHNIGKLSYYNDGDTKVCFLTRTLYDGTFICKINEVKTFRGKKDTYRFDSSKFIACGNRRRKPQQFFFRFRNFVLGYQYGHPKG